MVQIQLSEEITGSGPAHIKEQLWAAAETLRGRVSASHYRQYVLTLLFLRFVSVAQGGRRTKNSRRIRVPQGCSWSFLASQVDAEGLGEALDRAFAGIASANPELRGVFTEGLFADSGLSDERLAQLVRLFDSVSFEELGGDVFGAIYEYFMAHFALAEGQRGGEFYTPQSVVSLLVQMVAPFGGTVYDPCCGSGGMFTQSQQFVQGHGDQADITVFGQESNPTTWSLAKMNLAAHGLSCDMGIGPADTFSDDQHRSLKADYILANPPFNMSNWGRSTLMSDPRFCHGMPPKNNANFAWLQHILSHLSDDGVAGVVLSNGSLSVSAGGEGVIRERIIREDLVDCVVALPDRLFYSTQISVCLWILAKNKTAGAPGRDRRGEVLFLDARAFGRMVDRAHRVLDVSEIERIAGWYRSWRGDHGFPAFTTQPGFAASATLSDIEEHKFALVPGRFVGFSEADRAHAVGDVREDLRALQFELGGTAERSEEAIRLLQVLANG